MNRDKKINYFLGFIASVLFGYVVFCQIKELKKSDWGYYIETIEGTIICLQYDPFYIENNDPPHWIVGNYKTIQDLCSFGKDRMEFSRTINLSWYSFTEDKFFKGEFTIPKSELRRAKRLIEQECGYSIGEREFDFLFYNLEIGKNGKAAFYIFLRSCSNIQPCIGTFYAKEVPGDWRALGLQDLNREQYIHLMTSRYHWRPIFESDAASTIKIEMFNGEELKYPVVPENEKEWNKMIAIPERLVLLTDSNEEDFVFDKLEMNDYFNKIDSIDPSAETIFLIKQDTTSEKKLRIIMQNKHFTKELTQIPVKTESD